MTVVALCVLLPGRCQSQHLKKPHLHSPEKSSFLIVLLLIENNIECVFLAWLNFGCICQHALNNTDARNQFMGFRMNEVVLAQLCVFDQRLVQGHEPKNALLAQKHSLKWTKTHPEEFSSILSWDGNDLSTDVSKVKNELWPSAAAVLKSVPTS